MYVWVCMGLDGCMCSEYLPERTCHFQPPEHVARILRPGPKLAYGVRPGSLCAMEPRARGKTRGRKRKMPKGKKKLIYIYVYTWYVQGSPSGCALREIPGVTQVEKGHAGDTAVDTDYLCWVKHDHRSSRTRVPADYCY